MKVRVKIYSERGVHRVTVVGDDGFEAELVGVTRAYYNVYAEHPAALTLELIDFESPAIHGLGKR